MLQASDTIRRLEEKLSEMALAKDELEKGQSEYLEMVKQLEESKNMEAEERARLEEEMHAKREEVSENLIQGLHGQPADRSDFWDRS